MASRGENRGFETWTLHSPDGKASATFVPRLGGIGSSFVLPSPEGPRELLYQHEFFWDPDTTETRGGSPFLFPICGRLEREGVRESYTWQGEAYELPIHGFGLNTPWKVEETSSPDRLTMALTDTEETLSRYPFTFDVHVTYIVDDASLRCEQRVVNRGKEPMPYYAGFHPYFRTPGASQGKDSVRVSFKPVQRLVYNERLTKVIGRDDPPSFPCSITEPAITELLSKLGDDKEVHLHFPDGMTLHMKVEGENDPDLFPYLQMYTMPERPFFCIEPWMGYPNSLNEPGNVHLLGPGETERATMTLWASW